MSCNDNCSSIKNNCNKCCSRIKMFFGNCFPCLQEPVINNKKNEDDEDNDEVKLSNKDFNNKRTPSLNDYVVSSYINKKPTKPELSVPGNDKE